MALLLKSALDWAAVWHGDQLRKYPGARVPYVSHLAGVACILSRHGFDEEVVEARARRAAPAPRRARPGARGVRRLDPG